MDTHTYVLCFWGAHCWTRQSSCSSFMLVHAKSLQLSLTLCNPVDYSPPGSSVYGILQVRILEWFFTPSSSRAAQPRDQTCLSMSPALTGGFFTNSTTWEALLKLQCLRNGKMRFCGGVKWMPSGQSHSDSSEHLSWGGQSDPLRKLNLIFFSNLGDFPDIFSKFTSNSSHKSARVNGWTFSYMAC